MLKAGNEYTEKITDCTSLGAGTAKVDGFTVFVNGALPGETCRFKITEVKKRYAHATLLEILEISPDRRKADCTVFENCGGCTLCHVSPSLECDIKRNTVMNAFRQLKLPSEKIKPIEYPTTVLRNGVHIHIAENGDFGFYAEGSNSVCPFPKDGCLLIPSEFCEIAKCVSASLSEQYALPAQLFVRQSTSGTISVCLTTQNTHALPTLIGTLSLQHPNISGISARQNETENYHAVFGTPYIESKIADLVFRISPEAFFQVNYSGAELLFSKVLEYASHCDFSHCADLYCGTGTIGLILAAHFSNAHFTGVEINKSAVRDAKYNAKLNKIKNMDFYCDDAARFATEKSPELVVLDPPRRGLSKKMISVVLQIRPQNIIYVSCDPFTLARDCEKLLGGGYEIHELSPINMFPRSSHVETVCLLTAASNCCLQS